MNVSITTLSFAELLPLHSDDTELDLDFMLPRMLAFAVPDSMRAPIPQVPSPVCTADFPDRSPVPGTGSRGRGERKRRKMLSHDCPICLERITQGTAAALPCGHMHHRLCLFSVLTLPTLGSASMLRCPLCRYSVDRYDLKAFGCDVSPGNIARAARRCHRFRQLVQGGASVAALATGMAPSQWTAALVLGCSDSRADDGFVYNVCALAIERALFHRAGLARTLAALPRGPAADAIETSVACHVEVLMRTGRVTE